MLMLIDMIAYREVLLVLDIYTYTLTDNEVIHFQREGSIVSIGYDRKRQEA